MAQERTNGRSKASSSRSSSRSGERTDMGTILRFLDRTVNRHGVPVRIAVKRAARRFKTDERLIRMFYRSRDDACDY